MFPDRMRADPQSASVAAPAVHAPDPARQASRPGVPWAAQQMLALQSSAGNQAVLRLMGRSHPAYEEEELPGPVSQDGPAPAPASAPGPGAAPGPAPGPGAGPAPGPVPSPTITTRTLRAAPDGTASTRTAVGANEEVEVTS